MIVYDCEQGSQEWFQLRAGIPTSSSFSRLLTPTGKVSTQAEAYMFELIAERWMGHPQDSFMSAWMERGQMLEGRAGDYYAVLYDCAPLPVGFVTNDAGTVGASPDRLIGADGLLEIKCPSSGQHVGYLFGKGADRAYFPQLQGQLWVAEREWVDILSYHPELPEALVRVGRDEKYIESLAAVVTTFTEALEEQYRVLVEKIGEPPEREKPEPSMVDALKESLRDMSREVEV